ncbi:MAG: hypothetical protein ABI835_08495 [Chloroflexota bacterium]
MIKLTITRQLTLVFLICLTLVACAPHASNEVLVKPTLSGAQQIDSSDGVSAPPVLAPTEVSAPSDLRLASIQSGELVQQHPTVTWMGPVIGPGYVLPSTATLMPTTPAPTVEGQPSPTPPPTVEGQPTATTDGTNLFPEEMPTLNPEQMGIQFDLNLSQEEYDDVTRSLADLGVRWVKVQMSWKDMQPNSAGEVGDFFNRTRLYLQDLHLRQFKILVSVAKAPNWARSNPDQDGPPDDPQAYANFLTQMLTEFAGTIDAVEVWNEPNLAREWIGTLPFNGSGYMQLFNPAYSAIRAVSPSIPIISAGLAPTGDSAGSVDDRSYLRQMYAAGLGNYRDIAVGIHPYSWANPPEATCCGTAGWDDDPHFFFADNIRDYRQIMVDSGHADLQMWATEFGWASWEGYPGQPKPDSQWMLRTSKWDQANFGIRAFQFGQQNSYMGPMFLWNLNFAMVAGLIGNADERIAYSIEVPGSAGVIDPSSPNRTERPLYWMIHDAVRPDVELDQYD